MPTLASATINNNADRLRGHGMSQSTDWQSSEATVERTMDLIIGQKPTVGSIKKGATNNNEITQ